MKEASPLGSSTNHLTDEVMPMVIIICFSLFLICHDYNQCSFVCQLVVEWFWPRRGVGDGSHRIGGSPVRIHSGSETFHKVTSTRRAGNPYRFKLAHIPSNITIMITHPRPWTMSNRGNAYGILLFYLQSPPNLFSQK